LINDDKNLDLYKPSFFSTVKSILSMAFKASPVYLIVDNLMAIVNGVSFGLITLAFQHFFDNVTHNIGANVGLNGVMFSLVSLVLIIIFAQVINGLNIFMGNSYFKKVNGYLYERINIKSSKIEPIMFEDVKKLDDINKATMGASNSLGLLFTITSLFSYYLPYFIFMFSYLFLLTPVLSCTLIIVFIPLFLSQVVRSKIYAELEDEVAPIRRKNEYYKTYLGNKETRILGAYSFFKSLLQDSLKLMNKKVWEKEKKLGAIEVCLQMLTLLGYLVIIFMLIKFVMSKKISIGAFAAVFASIDNMFNTMREIVCRHIGGLTKNLGTINNFLRFLSLPESEGDEGIMDVSKGIQINNVVFKYPYTNKNAIDNISLNIKDGETIAIVGENGSGKTTLVKLLIGLYKPDEGDVFIGGLNTKKYKNKSLLKNTSAVFQNFQKYKMTLRENVEISDLNKENISDREFEKALSDSGLVINERSFNDGYDTMLAREFDGVELSGGQWQRIAIARAMYRKSNIIVLDEPTAAIDPIEESNLYKKFIELAKGKMAIIVTHRLASAKIADTILVVDQGKIVESGTHDELFNRKESKYSKMYISQMKWYERN
jgi:ATP-binding cassette subfamily B protein